MKLMGMGCSDRKGDMSHEHEGYLHGNSAMGKTSGRCSRPSAAKTAGKQALVDRTRRTLQVRVRDSHSVPNGVNGGESANRRYPTCFRWILKCPVRSIK